jgi:hypothetical protein
MGVDRESSEGVVYIKTLSTEDAGKVFRFVSPGVPQDIVGIHGFLDLFAE